MKESSPTLAVKQALFYLPMNILIDRVQSGKITLREVNQHRVKDIKNYILLNMPTHQVFFPSLVGHLEDGGLLQGDDGHISMIDGSHRLKAYVQLQQEAQKIIKGNDEHGKKLAFEILEGFAHTKLGIQLHRDLTVEQINQFYFDHNLLKKKMLISKWGFRYGEKETKRKRKSKIKTLGQ